MVALRASTFVFLLCWILIPTAFAQAEAPEYSKPEYSEPNYSIGEAAPAPIRLAYFSFVSGAVAWRVATDEETRSTPAEEWTRATINLPIRAGTEILVPSGARAELCFDDGSLVRLGGGARLWLETLSADANTELTVLRFDAGLATLKLRHPNSQFLVRAGSTAGTSTAGTSTALRAAGPATLRVGASGMRDQSLVEVVVQAGSAALENAVGHIMLHAGELARVQNGDANFARRRAPAPDAWDFWNLTRDEFRARDENTLDNLPPNIALVAGDLARFGDWQHDAVHGRVWRPRVSTPDWRPYRDGRWEWVYPFGWTWVSDEPWGWAPYHYGTWLQRSDGWVWVPGPASQPWSPSVVSFAEQEGETIWSPLAPDEVQYPQSLPIEQVNPSWAEQFSIGSAATYEPVNDEYAAPYDWEPDYVNHAVNITHYIYVTRAGNAVCKDDHHERHDCDRNPHRRPPNDWRKGDREKDRQWDRHHERRDDDKKPTFREWREWAATRRAHHETSRTEAEKRQRPAAWNRSHTSANSPATGSTPPAAPPAEKPDNRREQWNQAVQDWQEKQRRAREEREQRTRREREQEERKQEERQLKERQQKEQKEKEQAREREQKGREQNEWAEKIRRQFQQEREKQEKERAERQKSEQERREREREQRAREQQEREARAKAERQQREQEMQERQARERARAESERAAREKTLRELRERHEQEQREREQKERERREQSQREREQREREKQEQRERNQSRDNDNDGSSGAKPQRRWPWQR